MGRGGRGRSKKKGGGGSSQDGRTITVTTLSGEDVTLSRSAQRFVVTITAWVPTEDRGDVVGKQGANVQKLEAQFDTKVSFVKAGGGGGGGGGGRRRGGGGGGVQAQSTAAAAAANWRATARDGDVWWPLEITGKFTNSCATLAAILPLVDELESTVVVKIRPPASSRGGGSGGGGGRAAATLTKQWMVRQISVDSGARITSPSRGGQGVVLVEGTIDEVSRAFVLIVRELESSGGGGGGGGGGGNGGGGGGGAQKGRKKKKKQGGGGKCGKQQQQQQQQQAKAAKKAAKATPAAAAQETQAKPTPTRRKRGAVKAAKSESDAS